MSDSTKQTPPAVTRELIEEELPAMPVSGGLVLWWVSQLGEAELAAFGLRRVAEEAGQDVERVTWCMRCKGSDEMKTNHNPYILVPPAQPTPAQAGEAPGGGEVCKHQAYLEGDDDFASGPECGKQAKWLSCVPFTNTPSCDEHKCRCNKPLRGKRPAAPKSTSCRQRLPKSRRPNTIPPAATGARSVVAGRSGTPTSKHALTLSSRGIHLQQKERRMKMIVVSEDQWNLEWEKMLLELERAMREQPQPDPFRTVNFHLIGLKQRLEK